MRNRDCLFIIGINWLSNCFCI